MIDFQLLEKKIRRIEELLAEIEAVPGPGSLKDYSQNIVFKRFVERNVELAVEQVINIAKHLISALDLKEPETYAGALDLLAPAGVLTQSHLDTYKAMVRFRNLLVHGYDGVEDAVIYGIYKKRLGDFRDFIGEIRQYLVQHPSA